jgi:uncharacterized protein (TIGR00251 family)
MFASMDWACLIPHGGGVVLRLKASPNAARTTPESLRGDRLHLRVKAPPVEGKANREVLKWAAKAFEISAGRVTLLHGHRGRDKDLLLEGLSPAAAAAVLGRLVSKNGDPKGV